MTPKKNPKIFPKPIDKINIIKYDMDNGKGAAI